MRAYLVKTVAIVVCAIAVSACSFSPKEPLFRDSLPTQFHVSIGGYNGASYSVQLQNDYLVYSAADCSFCDKRSRKIRPNSEAWRQFWSELELVDLWSWRSEYKPPDYVVVSDGTQWHLTISYKDHHITSRGDNAYPSDINPGDVTYPTAEGTARFRKLSGAVSRLVGGLPFE